MWYDIISSEAINLQTVSNFECDDDEMRILYKNEIHIYTIFSFLTGM